MFVHKRSLTNNELLIKADLGLLFFTHGFSSYDCIKLSLILANDLCWNFSFNMTVNIDFLETPGILVRYVGNMASSTLWGLCLAAHQHLDRCHCCDKGFHGGGRHNGGLGVPPDGCHGNMNSICIHMCVRLGVCLFHLKYTLKQQTRAAQVFSTFQDWLPFCPPAFLVSQNFACKSKFSRSHK